MKQTKEHYLWQNKYAGNLSVIILNAFFLMIIITGSSFPLKAVNVMQNEKKTGIFDSLSGNPHYDSFFSWDGNGSGAGFDGNQRPSG